MLEAKKQYSIGPLKDSFEARLRDRLALGTFGGVPVIQTFSGGYRQIGSISYNGEKTPGELGPIKNYFADYDALRARSWQLYYESELAQIIMNQHIKWVIGNGLKLQSEPVKDMIKEEIGSFNAEKFSRAVETRFKVYSKSRASDYADMQNLNLLESEAYKNCKLGGDVLVILRYVDDMVKVELIDGAHVQSPIHGSEYFPLELPNGNRVVNGIEINERKQHVAYYVRKDYRTLDFTKVPARGGDGDSLMAYMVYGNKYRLDNYRGMPLLSVLFETAKKLERYKEATVGSAEERAKIPYAIEHDIFSTGESPLTRQTVLARDVEHNMANGFVPRDSYGKELADRIGVTTEKMVFNMPLGAHLKSLETKNDLYFKDFYSTNVMLFCAAAGIPYEVAMSKYDSNYSASRGAIKDWEHKLNVERGNFSFQFMQPIYDFWLEVQILQGRISAPGYMIARISNDRMLMEAYRNARFVGPPVPHIDPEKEVKAERLKLGAAGADIPLTTVEQATENLSGGDSDANIEQFARELKTSKSLGIKMEEPPKPIPGSKPAKPTRKKKA